MSGRPKEANLPVIRFSMVVAGMLAALCVSRANADIYTWTDASGRVNISNLTPPDGVHVTKVLREAPKPTAPTPVAVPTTPQADIDVLAARVRQLEWEAEIARRQASAPTIIYAAPQPQPQVQYPVYAPESAPAPSYGYANNYGCDPSWAGCGLGFGLPYYYPSVVVIRTPGFHRHGFDRGRHPMHPIAGPAPIRGSGPGRPSGPPSRGPSGASRR